MRLVVLGSLPAAMTHAAWAAAVAPSTLVTHVCPHTDGKADEADTAWLGTVSWQGEDRPAAVRRAALDQVPAADAYLFVAAREETLDTVRRIAPSLHGRPALFAPGGFGVVEGISRELDSREVHPAALGQVPGFAVTGSIHGNHYPVTAVKRSLPVGFRDADTNSSDSLKCFQTWFPDLKGSTLLEASMSNTNHVLHPPLVLVNATRIENREHFLLYRDGVSATAARLIAAVDADRMKVLERFGRAPVSTLELMLRFYADQGLRGSDWSEVLRSFPAYASVAGPRSLEHRFVIEDVSSGLAPLEALGLRAGVETPDLSALITCLSTICDRDLRSGAGELVKDISVSRRDPPSSTSETPTPP